MSATISKIPRPDGATLRRLYVDEGKGAPEIGRMFERDAKTVWWWLKQAGIEMRPRGTDPRQHFKKGERGGFAGRKHSAESREKIRAATIADGRVPYLRDGQHWLKTVSADANPNWKGGATPERQEFYRSPEWKLACRIVWARDNACCRSCGKDWRTVDRSIEPMFHIHHVWSFQFRECRANPAFLVLLCRKCHLWVHSKQNVTRAWLPQEPDGTHFPSLDELSDEHYLKAAEREFSMPSLFDAMDQAA